MLPESITMHDAAVVVDDATKVAGLFQFLRHKTSDEAWEVLLDSDLGDLLDALSDLEYEVEGAIKGAAA